MPISRNAVVDGRRLRSYQTPRLRLGEEKQVKMIGG